MDQEAIALISEKIVSDVNFWTASIGFFGVILGALITGGLSFFQNKQSINNVKLEKKKELLLMKYELMYQELDSFTEFVNEISTLSISSIDSTFRPASLKSDLKNNRFVMYSYLYTPELSDKTKGLQEELGSMMLSLSKLIIDSSDNRSVREAIIGEVVTSSVKISTHVDSIKQELITLTDQLIKA